MYKTMFYMKIERNDKSGFEVLRFEDDAAKQVLIDSGYVETTEEEWIEANKEYFDVEKELEVTE